MPSSPSIWERFYQRFRAAVRPDPNATTKHSFEELLKNRPLTPYARAIKALTPPPPPAGVTIDWTQAPDGFHIWRYHEDKQVAVWLNGKNRTEEWGIVWEAMPAPTFGVTTDSKATMSEEEGRRRRAIKLAEQLRQTLPAAVAAKRKPRF